MEKNKKSLIIILARKGSKRLKNKNLRLIGKKSLVENTILFAKRIKGKKDIIIRNKKLSKLDNFIINIGNENIKLTKIKKIFLSFFKKNLDIEDKKISVRKDSSQIICTKKFDKISKWKKKKIEDTLIMLLKKK